MQKFFGTKGNQTETELKEHKTFAERIDDILKSYKEKEIDKRKKVADIEKVKETDLGVARYWALNKFHIENKDKTNYQALLMQKLELLSIEPDNGMAESRLVFRILNVIQQENQFAFYFDGQRLHYKSKFITEDKLDKLDDPQRKLLKILQHYDAENRGKERFPGADSKYNMYANFKSTEEGLDRAAKLWCGLINHIETSQKGETILNLRSMIIDTLRKTEAAKFFSGSSLITTLKLKFSFNSDDLAPPVNYHNMPLML